MATRITQEKIIEINNAYLKTHTYSGAAKITGVSAATVKKYLIPNYIPAEKIEPKRFDRSLLKPEMDTTPFKTKNWGELCVLSSTEKAEIKELWNELSI